MRPAGGEAPAAGGGRVPLAALLRAAAGAGLGLPRRAASRARHELGLGRDLYRRAGEAPLALAERVGPVAAGAPQWRVLFVGRRRLMADFDFLAPQGTAWQVRGAGRGGDYPRLIASARAHHAEAAGAGVPGLRLVERWWGLPTAAGALGWPAGLLARLGLVVGDGEPLHAGWASHLSTTCPVADSRAAQEALLTSPDLRERWRAARGLRHEISVDPGDLRAFYDRMVRGQNRRRFGDTGAELPRAAFVRELGRGGFLIKVMTLGRRPTWASGVMMTPTPSGRGLTVFRPGVADADAQSDGRLAELTCYHDIAALDVARERRLTSLELGLTRALSHNPIFRHKKALGARFRPAERGPRFDVFAAAGADALLARHAPLVTV